MKIIVTGGAGFVGSHVAEYFALRGNRVVVVDNFSRSKTLSVRASDPIYNWKYLSNGFNNIQLSKVDISKPTALETVAKRGDAIIHAAAQVAVTTSLKDPRTDFETNAKGTFNVLEAARKNDATVVFCSTNKVYGANVNTANVRKKKTRYAIDQSSMKGIDENLAVDHTSHTPYGSSKLAADIYVQDYFHTYGLRTGVFRMSCIYGERQFGVEDQGWLAWFTIASLTGKRITIYGDGKQVRDVLYVKDLVDAFDRFLKSNLRHAVFNIGGGPRNTLSLIELLILLRKITGITARVSFSNWRPADQKVYISDIRKAQRVLRWRPKVSPEVGVRLVSNWVQANMQLFS